MFNALAIPTTNQLLQRTRRTYGPSQIKRSAILRPLLGDVGTAYIINCWEKCDVTILYAYKQSIVLLLTSLLL